MTDGLETDGLQTDGLQTVPSTELSPCDGQEMVA